MSVSQYTNVFYILILISLFAHIKPALSQQRTCVINDDGATICGKPTTVKKETKKPQSTGYRKEINNFVLLLKKCKRSDTNVKCDLVVTNKGAERELSLNPAFIKIIDSAGKSHQCQTVEFGSGDVTAKITPGVEYAATLNFGNIPDQISQAQILEIDTGVTGVGVFQFRKVYFTN